MSPTNVQQTFDIIPAACVLWLMLSNILPNKMDKKYKLNASALVELQ